MTVRWKKPSLILINGLTSPLYWEGDVFKQDLIGPTKVKIQNGHQNDLTIERRVLTCNHYTRSLGNGSNPKINWKESILRGKLIIKKNSNRRKMTMVIGPKWIMIILRFIMEIILKGQLSTKKGTRLITTSLTLTRRSYLIWSKNTTWVILKFLKAKRITWRLIKENLHISMLLWVVVRWRKCLRFLVRS